MLREPVLIPSLHKYARYKDRFDIWCGFDYTGFDKPGWEKHALEELERCHKKGAKGVGELAIRGWENFIPILLPPMVYI